MQEISNEQLVETIQTLRGDEKRVVAKLIRYLHELDERRYYRELGFSSLHAYCTERLGYSNSAAWRRISTARALETCPELTEKLERGDLSLCTASQIARVVTPENKEELFAQTEGKSKREVEKVLSNYLPERAAPTKLERVRVSATKEPTASLFQTATPPRAKKTYTITLELTEEEMTLVEEAQKLLSTSKVKDALLGSAKKLIGHKRALEKKREARARRESLPPVAVNAGEETQEVKSTRYTAADVRHAVEQRDGCQCTFVAADGTQCSETRWLQLDHILPFALGGLNTVENLRLRCFAHNQLEAENVFGKAAIRRLVKFKQKIRLAQKSV